MLVILECTLFLLLLGGIVGVLSLTGDDLKGAYIRRFGWREGRFRYKQLALAVVMGVSALVPAIMLALALIYQLIRQ